MARDSKGRFLKRGRARKRGRSRRRRSVAMVRRRSSAPRTYARRRRSSSGGGGGFTGKYGLPSLRTLGAASLVGFVSKGSNATAAKAAAYVDRMPGVKSFGRPAGIAVGAWLVDRFFKPHWFLKELVRTGTIIAAAKIGEDGYSVTWVGDVGDDDDELLSGPDVEDVEYEDG